MASTGANNEIRSARTTASTYTIGSAQTSNAGNYDVVVSNSGGSTVSAVATLTVTSAPIPPTITGQPASQTVPAGGSASFTVTASGSTPLAYQWRFNGGNITGATASTFTIANVQPSGAGNYDVVVSNSAGFATSSVAVLTVSTASLLVNGSFENDYTGWTPSGNQAIATRDPAHPASSGSKVVVFSPGNAFANAALSQTFATVTASAMRFPLTWERWAHCRSADRSGFEREQRPV